MTTLKLHTSAIVLLVISVFCIGHIRAQHLHAPAHAGVASIPAGEAVYSFLRHLSVRGVISGYSESVLPLSEYEIVRFLKEANADALSGSERELRAKYLRTYEREPYDAVTVFPAEDATPLFFEGIPTEKDKYLYRWRDTATHSDLQVNALGILEVRSRSVPTSGTAALGVIGGRIRGTLSGHVGYFLETTNGSTLGGDSSIAGEDPVIGRNKNFAIYSKQFFDNTTAELSYTYDWFTAKLARNALSVGGGYAGDNVFVSPGIPTIDYLSLSANVGAVRYYAIVGSLLGDARFSARLDSTLYNFGPGSYIDPKYLALHHVSILLGDEVEFGFTDMTIFSRRFELAYLNPFSFMKTVEHSLNDRDNGLLGAHVRWRIVPGVEVRAQALMDDVIFSRIGTGWWGNKFAWQFGVLWAAPLGFRDLDIAAEYTHVEPFMYTHFNTQNNFTTSGAVIGSPIGPNSKRFLGKVSYRPTAKLAIELTASLVQHGENMYDSAGAIIYNAGADIERTVSSDAENAASYNILGGRRVNSVTIDGSVQYELWRGIELFVRATDRSVTYSEGTPASPQATPYRLITGGIRATL